MMLPRKPGGLQRGTTCLGLDSRSPPRLHPITDAGRQSIFRSSGCQSYVPAQGCCAPFFPCAFAHLQGGQNSFLPTTWWYLEGSSLSDNGNLYTVIHLPVPPTYDLGRSTDGTTTYPASSMSGLWEEQLAPSLGLADPRPDLVNTVNLNFAFAGAETGALADSASGAYGMAAQVQRYLDEKPANVATAVHIFWGGTNDVFEYADPVSAEKTAVANISNQIGSIAQAGGRYSVWLNLFPLELTPRGGGNPAIKAACANLPTDLPRP